MPPYELSAAAQDDLREIARYTLKQWGKAQSFIYAGSLDLCFVEIAAHTRHSRPILESQPTLRVSRCEHHLVFYLHPKAKPPTIIGVLHERMDLLQHLKSRLP